MRWAKLVLLSVFFLVAPLSSALSADDFQEADRLYFAGEWAQAESLYAKIPASHADYASSLLRRGTICYTTGRPAQAAELFENYLRLRPTAEAYCLLAGAQFNLEKLDDAYASAKEAIQLDPRYARAYTSLGMIYTAIKDFPDAQAAFQESLRLNPGDADTWFIMGRSYFLRDDFPKARAAFESSRRLNPKEMRCYENLALTLDLMDQPAEAETAYQQGIKVNQERKYPSPQIYIDYGKFLAKRGRPAESLAQLREAVRVAPQGAEAHYELSSQLARMQEWAEAAREGETALHAGPSDYRIHYLLARIYTAMGNTRAAAEHAEEAARLTDQRP